MASSLPVYCTGLSIDSTIDEDFFEIDMFSGVTYYVNVSLNNANGDLDVQWESASGSYLTGSGTTSNLESMSYTSFSNQTTYVKVYGWLSAINTYDIEITTDLPGGGQTFESVYVTQTNTTNVTIEIEGLTAGTNYSYNHSSVQYFDNGSSTWGSSTVVNFNATGTTYTANITTTSPIMIESEYCTESYLMDAAGGVLDFDGDCVYIEVLELDSLSSTTGSISATNLTTATDYTLWWFVYDTVEFGNNYSLSNDVDVALASSMVHQETENFTSTTPSESWSVNWTGITTMNQHELVGLLSYTNTVVNLSTGEGYIGFHFSDFIPQLPSMVIDAYSTSSTSSTNDVDVKGADLVTGDSYKYQVRVVDQAGASVASSSMMNFTATAQNMSMPTFSYTTPTASGVYCAEVQLYSAASVQLVGDSACFNLVFDDDNDGVANEFDLCANTTIGAFVDQDGCELSQKDSDGDGYNDAVDAFPTDASQYSDMDGDGYGDNASGNSPDAFPMDSSQSVSYTHLTLPTKA